MAPVDESTFPLEVVEKILSFLVDLWDDDPAYQWTSLRHLSPVQMRRIEARFREVWLPTMSITMYYGAGSVEYRFDRCSGDDEARFTVDDYSATFLNGVASGDEDGAMFDRAMAAIRSTWDGYMAGGVGRHGVFVRFGEGVLNRGARGGYIINDTVLPGLAVDYSAPGYFADLEWDDLAWNLRFRWRGAVDELMREEMFMRRLTRNVVAEFKWEEVERRSTEDLNPPEVRRGFMGHRVVYNPPLHVDEDARLVKTMMNAWMARRAAVRRHMAARAGEQGPHIRERSRVLHRQRVECPLGGGGLKGRGLEIIYDSRDEDPPPYGPWCPHCFDNDTPDIFEVVAVEESVVPATPQFQDWLRKDTKGEAQLADSMVVLELYAEELSWAQVRRHGRSGDREAQAHFMGNNLRGMLAAAERQVRRDERRDDDDDDDDDDDTHEGEYRKTRREKKRARAALTEKGLRWMNGNEHW